MNRGNLYTLIFLLLVATGVGIYFYSSNQEEPIPPLKDRQGPISTTSEWLNTKAAINELQFKLRKNKNDTQSKLLLALAYMQEARITGEHPYYYPAALQLVNEVLDRKNADPAIRFEATVAKASIELSLHQFENARETGMEALKMNAQRAAIYGVLCDANVELGDYDQAIVMADKMVAIRPDLMSYARVSYLREIHGDLDGAIQAMEMAANAGMPGLEQTAWTKYTLGQLYEKTGNLQQAEVIYQQILNERPSYAFAIGGLGKLEAKKGNTPKAIELLEQAAAVLPEFTFQEELTSLYSEAGQKNKAADTLKELLAGLEEDQEAGHIVDLELASIYSELGHDYDTALKYAMKEYKRRPNNIDVNKTLAAIYYKQQNYKQASAHLQRAMRTQRKDAATLCLDGLLAYKTGDKAAAQTLLQQSFSLDPFQSGSLSAEGKKLLRGSLSSL
ncbi:tetratricopeptide repeat protein [Pontibacter sp. CAU 1760]